MFALCLKSLFFENGGCFFFRFLAEGHSPSHNENFIKGNFNPVRIKKSSGAAKSCNYTAPVRVFTEKSRFYQTRIGNR